MEENILVEEKKSYKLSPLQYYGIHYIYTVFILWCPLNICVPIHCPGYSFYMPNYLGVYVLLDTHILDNHTPNYNLPIFLHLAKAQKDTKLLSNSVGVCFRGSTKNHYIVLLIYVAIMH